MNGWRRACPSLLALWTLTGGGCAPPAPLETPAESPHAALHQRADAMLTSLVERLWNPDTQYFDRALTLPGFPAAYWNYAQGLDALADGLERTRGQQFAGWLPVAVQGQERRYWLEGLYDDENWMSMTLLRAYDLVGDPAYLERAQFLYEDIQLGWDETCCGEVKGGIWWDKAKTGKATASNAGPVITGVRLAQRSGQSKFLAFAQRAYDHWRANMVISKTGQVVDNIPVSGTPSSLTFTFTYNEGLMLGAALELHRATGESRYLEDAHLIAGRLVSFHVRASSAGPVLFDGDAQTCQGDCHQFKGIASRYLALLQAVDPRQAYDAVLTSSAEAITTLALDGKTGFSAVDWRGGPLEDGSLAQQTSALFAVSGLAALRDGLPSTRGEASVHEAEDAPHWNVRLRTVEGAGVLVTKGDAGERVRFQVHAFTAGPHQLTVRYRALAAEAVRSLSVDSGPAQSITLSAGTEHRWTQELAPGPHTVDLSGGEGLVELDALDVVPGDAPAVGLGALFLTAPSPGGDACPDARVCWSASEGADGYDVVVDGQLHCSTTSARCCSLDGLTPGPHRWSVWAKREGARRASPASSFTLTPWPSAAAQPTAQAMGGGRVRWTWPEDAAAWDGYDFIAGEVLSCAGVRSPACITGQDVSAPTVRARRSCPRTP